MTTQEKTKKEKERRSIFADRYNKSIYSKCNSLIEWDTDENDQKIVKKVDFTRTKTDEHGNKTIEYRGQVAHLVDLGNRNFKSTQYLKCRQIVQVENLPEQSELQEIDKNIELINCDADWKKDKKMKNVQKNKLNDPSNGIRLEQELHNLMDAGKLGFIEYDKLKELDEIKKFISNERIDINKIKFYEPLFSNKKDAEEFKKKKVIVFVLILIAKWV